MGGFGKDGDKGGGKYDGGGKFDGGGKGGGKKGKDGGFTQNYGIKHSYFGRKALDISTSVLSYLEHFALGVDQPDRVTGYLGRILPHRSFARDLLPPHLLPAGEAYAAGCGLCTREV